MLVRQLENVPLNEYTMFLLGLAVSPGLVPTVPVPKFAVPVSSQIAPCGGIDGTACAGTVIANATAQAQATNRIRRTTEPPFSIPSDRLFAPEPQGPGGKLHPAPAHDWASVMWRTPCFPRSSCLKHNQSEKSGRIPINVGFGRIDAPSERIDRLDDQRRKSGRSRKRTTDDHTREGKEGWNRTWIRSVGSGTPRHTAVPPWTSMGRWVPTVCIPGGASIRTRSSVGLIVGWPITVSE